MDESLFVRQRLGPAGLDHTMQCKVKYEEQVEDSSDFIHGVATRCVQDGSRQVYRCTRQDV